MALDYVMIRWALPDYETGKRCLEFFRQECVIASRLYPVNQELWFSGGLFARWGADLAGGIAIHTHYFDLYVRPDSVEMIKELFTVNARKLTNDEERFALVLEMTPVTLCVLPVGS